MGIDYLVKKGHRLVGLVIPKIGTHSEIRYRLWLSRMEQEFQASGIDIDPDSLVVRAEIGDTDDILKERIEPPLIMQPSDDNFASYSSFNIGMRAGLSYLSSKNPATAFICFNDDVAYGFIRVLEKNGLNVPEDISVMGIDGIYLRDWFEKSVTTVCIDAENIGAVATNVMIDILENKKAKYMNWTCPSILEGETVKHIGG
jgi:DNA-binding LacI/PurR family transcriptional regulator